MKSALSYLAAFALALSIAGCTKEPPLPQFGRVLPPVLSPPMERVELSVLHVVNPRLPRFSPEQITTLLRIASEAAREQFEVGIKFGAVVEIEIDPFFAETPPAAMMWRQRFMYDFKTGKGDRAALEHAYRVALDRQKGNIAEWAPFAARELKLPRVDHDLSLWPKRLAETHIARLASLAETRALDGKPTIDGTPYNEWLKWDTIGERVHAADFIITNQLVASAEYAGVDVHSALRGGLTIGSTAYSRTARMFAQSWWSTFPFSSNDAVIVAMRGGEIYTAEEAAVLAGTFAAHELGHLLFHYDHPFGVSACVMSPTPMLRFREQAAKLDGVACRRANNPAMKKGSAEIQGPLTVQ